MSRHLWIVALAATLGLVAAPAMAQISDSFETDTSADYTVVDDSNGASGDGGFDGTIDFAFDYVFNFDVVSDCVFGFVIELVLAFVLDFDFVSVFDFVFAFNVGIRF